jgi:CheY-like chemotaxis protein
MCVEDSGLGISEAQQASIAAFFLQGKGEGVGTGLTVVRRILTALEGTIQFSSRLGHGTVVCVTIPLYRAQPLQDAPAVLVVDDEPLQRDLLRRLLLGLGRFAIREVESGAAALRVLAQEPVHMVLVDMDLADMSGLEVARILREREHAAGQSPVPVFLVTGFAPEELPDTHHPQWGPLVQGVLQKPVPVDKLRTALEQAGLPVDAPWDDADALAQLGGDLQLLNDLRRMFAAEAPQRLSEGRAALERGDLATALRMFHALKGNAATIGATEVSTLARAVHDALRLGHVNEAVSLLPALQTALDRVGMVLKEKPHESTL